MTAPIATLSMYDWPETRTALDTFWELVKAELVERKIKAPEHLHHQEEQMPLWLSPDLVVGQTCGWPYANKLRSRVIPFARFDYGLEGCPPGTYKSVYIGNSLEDAKYLKTGETLAKCPSIAMNGDDSQSGFHVFSEISGIPTAETIPETNRHITGAHRNSIKAVANGDAQIAAIDAVAFELAKKYEPEATQRVHILGSSIPKPGLPLITSPELASSAETLLIAIRNAHAKLAPDMLEILMIKQVLPAHDLDYDVFQASR